MAGAALTPSAAKGLVALAALDAGPYNAVVAAAFDDLVSGRKGDGEGALLANKAVASADKPVVKLGYGALVSTLLQSARANADADALGGTLEENGLSAAQIKAVVDLYTVNKEKLRVELRKTSIGLPHVTDVDWKLEYFMKSNQLDKVNEAQYTLQLSTEDADGQKDTIQLGCSLAQMQDLVSKLRDASKRLELLTDSGR